MVGPVVDEQAFKVVIDALADYRAGRAASP
jgi:hypothetical protein